MIREYNRCLIVKKLWLDKILDQGKIWEMRSRPTKIRGRIGLIESGSGLIVGEVDLEGCSSEPIEKNAKYIKYHYIEDLELLDTWSWAWYLKNARRYKTPIPYNHPKGAVIWVKLKKNKYDL